MTYMGQPYYPGWLDDPPALSSPFRNAAGKALQLAVLNRPRSCDRSRCARCGTALSLSASRKHCSGLKRFLN
jgi:hypothetical protein